MNIYIEQRYCMECVCVHWMQVTENNKEICKGEGLSPTEPGQGYYTRRQGTGYELIATIAITHHQDPLPIAFQMRIDSGE